MGKIFCVEFQRCPLKFHTKYLTHDDFNQHFANIGNKINAKFQDLSDELFWKGSKSIHTFRFTKVSNRDIEKYLSSQPKKSNYDILGMDVVLLRKSAPYIYEPLATVINKSLESGVFEQDWKMSRLFITMMVTSMTKTITVQYRLSDIQPR